MGEQYGLEITPAVTELWQEALSGLTPNQIREGYLTYQKSDAARFRPQPGDIIARAPEKPADRPRKIKDPDCAECRGSGYRMIEVDSIIHPGKKAKRVTDCYCVRIEYDGKSYIPEQRQLPSAVDSARVKDVEAKIDSAAKGKAMPRVREQTDAEYNARQQELKRQAKELLK